MRREEITNNLQILTSVPPNLRHRAPEVRELTPEVYPKIGLYELFPVGFLELRTLAPDISNATPDINSGHKERCNEI